MRARAMFALTLIILVSQACAVPSQFTDLLGGSNPTQTPVSAVCAPESLAAPQLSNPVNWRIDDNLSPTLTWTYPDPGCVPAGYDVALSMGPLFEKDLGAAVTAGPSSWSPAQPLVPGKEYRWSVRASGGAATGPESDIRYFYTGPVCDTSALVAPTLLDPVDASTITDASPTLVWEYPGDCTPQAYTVDISGDPEFRGNNLGGGSGYPAARWVFTQPLVDCRRYYWRVAPVNAGTSGPDSPVFAFVVDLFGQCGPSSGIGKAQISGQVWSDQCSPLEGAPATPLPTGCVDNGSGGVQANGTHEQDEPAVAGVRVSLGVGACPSTGLTTATSGSDGHYKFAALTAGTYCVSIDGSAPPNDKILKQGIWTAPGGTAGVLAGITVTLGADEASTGSDFGWYLVSVPAPTATSNIPTLVASTTPIPTAKLTVTKNVNCRYGPDKVYDILTSVNAGHTFPILGRSNDSSWWYVRIGGGFECWIAATAGTTQGDLNSAPILTPPPPPTAKPGG